MAARGRYSTVSARDRERLIEAYEAGRDLSEVSHILGIKSSTVRSIITSYINTGERVARKRGGDHHRKVDQEMRTALQGIIDDDPLLTLRSINVHLRNRLPHKPLISLSCLANTLDKMLVTIKLVRDQPAQRNSAEVLDARFYYATWFLEQDSHVIYIDECGYNVWTRRSYGRSPRGTPAVRTIAKQRGCNVMCTLAISPTLGLLHSRLRVETITKERFQEFLNGLVEVACQHFNPEEKITIVFDNARPHSGATVPAQYAHRVELRHLPPYSPFLNPVEQAHSAFKATVKDRLSAPAMQKRCDDMDVAEANGLSLHAHRSQILLEIGAASLPAITVDKCVAWCRHPYSYMQRSLNYEPVME